MLCRTDRGFFCNTFFNQTVDVVDRPHWVDTQLLFLAFIGASVLGVIGEHCFSLRLLSQIYVHGSALQQLGQAGLNFSHLA